MKRLLLKLDKHLHMNHKNLKENLKKINHLNFHIEKEFDLLNYYFYKKYKFYLFYCIFFKIKVVLKF